jgi:hypothetical protein
MGRNALIALGCLLSLMVGRLSPGFGSDAIALISSIVGNVEFQRASEQEWRAARMGDQLFEGDVLRTHDHSKASLFFSNGSIITVHPKSRVALSLREMDEKTEGSLTASVSRGVMERIGGIFSAEKKRETLTAVPGIRKKIEEEEMGVRVLYPRNSMILTPRPHVRWNIRGKHQMVMVSLTLKGMGGRLWTLNTKETEIPYPKDQRPLEPGQTYFVRVESMDDSSVSDEVYFRILDDQSAEDVRRIAKQMEALRKSNPDDITPEFILTTFYRNNGLYHMALERLDTLEMKTPGERFVLEEKREIFAKIGFWKKWDEVNQKLMAP